MWMKTSLFHIQLPHLAKMGITFLRKEEQRMYLQLSKLILIYLKHTVACSCSSFYLGHFFCKFGCSKMKTLKHSMWRPPKMAHITNEIIHCSSWSEALKKKPICFQIKEFIKTNIKQVHFRQIIPTFFVQVIHSREKHKKWIIHFSFWLIILSQCFPYIKITVSCKTCWNKKKVTITHT